ncbi:antitoxin VbhA family protein [uncultured Corynebacterium sp.]|uniref:antitoxin VbhA family protein n=1 Tax=uncultured Corynebacterium sp. TaxID=159447 RepID=UPI0025D4292F|nr:antitoxin VbhA family protein [uncultured Corynebacterium sp.]
MTADNRTEDQKVAAVRASMTMAGHTIDSEQEARLRRVLRGEITGDEAALEVIESSGYGDSERAKFLRKRIAESRKESQTSKSDDLTDNA